MTLTVFGMFTVEGSVEDLASYTAQLCDMMKRMHDQNQEKEIGYDISDLMKNMGLDETETGERNDGILQLLQTAQMRKGHGPGFYNRSGHTHQAMRERGHAEDDGRVSAQGRTSGACDI